MPSNAIYNFKLNRNLAQQTATDFFKSIIPEMEETSKLARHPNWFYKTQSNGQHTQPLWGLILFSVNTWRSLSRWMRIAAWDKPQLSRFRILRFGEISSCARDCWKMKNATRKKFFACLPNKSGSAWKTCNSRSMLARGIFSNSWKRLAEYSFYHWLIGRDLSRYWSRWFISLCH